VTQQWGIPGNHFLVVLVVQKRPATEALNSRFESAQKTTAGGANWERFGFDCGAVAKCTAIFCTNAVQALSCEALF
jgi:hypothetical protein